MADINVTMTVDTAKLSSGESPADSTVLSDNHGDTPGSTTFVIHATAGQTIQFSIQAKNGTTPVSFNAFRYEGGDTIFNPLPNSDNNWTGTATGHSGEDESYYIDFKSNNVDYTLDPDIQLDPPG